MRASQTFAVAAIPALVAVALLSACTTEKDPAHTDDTTSRTGSATETSNRTGPTPTTAGGARPADGTDLSNGGTCVGGQDITISVDDSGPVINGDCGTVTVTGSRISGNIANAEAVHIAGSDVGLLGTDWSTVTVDGDGATINVDALGSVTMNGADSQITNRSADAITVTSDDVTVNSDGVGSLTLDGNRAIVVVSGAVDRLVVTGDDNIVNWDDGVEAADSDAGTGNTYTR